jgi:hypothetical protein
MKTTRRSVLLSSLLGPAGLGLQALATGLPASFLLRSSTARAGEPLGCTNAEEAQFLILSVSGDGDPLNANAPGTYGDPGIVHPAIAVAPHMAPTALKLGQVATTAARPWSTLPAWVLDRTSFFHMATMTTIHPDMPKVLQLMGDTRAREMLPSLFSRYLATCLGTVQAAPVSLLGTKRAEYIAYGGNIIPNMNPVALRDILVRPEGPLAQLTQLRDRSMDRLHARLRMDGSAAQRSFVDGLARSRAEARAVSDELLSSLHAIRDDDVTGQILGAVALIAMKVTSVVVIRIPFGGDNHADFDLVKESEETQSGVAAIAALMGKLQEQGLQDRVTFATLNVFGRTLKQLGTKGRHHWADHQVSLLVGKRIRPGVIGGVAPGASQDYTALAIDSQTGAAGGDIPVSETLSAFGKTLGRAVGLPQDVLEQNIGKGKVVQRALLGLASGAFLLSATARATVTPYRAHLDGKQLVPPLDVVATGEAEFSFDDETKRLTGTATYRGLSGTPSSAELFQGACGSRGASPFAMVDAGATASAIDVNLDDAQANELAAGSVYVIVRTGAHADGEIRGQLYFPRPPKTCPPAAVDAGNTSTDPASGAPASTGPAPGGPWSGWSSGSADAGNANGNSGSKMSGSCSLTRAMPRQEFADVMGGALAAIALFSMRRDRSCRPLRNPS